MVVNWKLRNREIDFLHLIPPGYNMCLLCYIFTLLVYSIIYLSNTFYHRHNATIHGVLLSWLLSHTVDCLSDWLEIQTIETQPNQHINGFENFPVNSLFYIFRTEYTRTYTACILSHNDKIQSYIVWLCYIQSLYQNIITIELNTFVWIPNEIFVIAMASKIDERFLMHTNSSVNSLKWYLYSCFSFYDLKISNKIDHTIHICSVFFLQKRRYIATFAVNGMDGNRYW